MAVLVPGSVMLAAPVEPRSCNPPPIALRLSAQSQQQLWCQDKTDAGADDSDEMLMAEQLARWPLRVGDLWQHALRQRHQGRHCLGQRRLS